MIQLADSSLLTVDDFKGVDVVLTDPPYGINLKSNCKGGVKDRRIIGASIQGDTDQSAGVHVLNMARAASVPLIIFFASPNLMWPGKFRNLIVWDKGGGTGFGGDTSTCLRRTWELIQVENKNPIVSGRPESVWRVTFSNAIFKDHPCAKPVELIRRLLSVFVGQKATVFDPFMGSGTTGVACIEAGHNFKGNEIDPKHFETAKKRILEAAQKYNGQPNLGF